MTFVKTKQQQQQQNTAKEKQKQIYHIWKLNLDYLHV